MVANGAIPQRITIHKATNLWSAKKTQNATLAGNVEDLVLYFKILYRIKDTFKSVSTHRHGTYSLNLNIFSVRKAVIYKNENLYENLKFYEPIIGEWKNETV